MNGLLAQGMHDLQAYIYKDLGENKVSFNETVVSSVLCTINYKMHTQPILPPHTITKAK